MSAAPRRRRVTREDVARLAGTSTAVVSYVINDGPRPVSDATRARVLEAIAEVGYEPNTIARALASGVTGLYGLVVPSISNPFFAALAHELEDAIAATGKVLLLADSSDDKRREIDVIKALARRRADGVFFIGVDDSPNLHALAGIPVVLLDRVTPEQSAHYSVTIDNESAAHAATQHLLEHGYAHTAIICGPRNLSVGRSRYEGWRRALREAGIAPGPEWALEAAFSARGGLEAGRALLGSARPPRAVFASSEQQTLGLLAAAAEASLRVPDDVAVMSFDGTEASEYAVPRVSGIVQDLAGIAQAAVGTLQTLSAKGRPASRHTVVGYELRIRASCGAHGDRGGTPARA